MHAMVSFINYILPHVLSQRQNITGNDYKEVCDKPEDKKQTGR